MCLAMQLVGLSPAELANADRTLKHKAIIQTDYRPKAEALSLCLLNKVLRIDWLHND